MRTARMRPARPDDIPQDGMSIYRHDDGNYFLSCQLTDVTHRPRTRREGIEVLPDGETWEASLTFENGSTSSIVRHQPEGVSAADAHLLEDLFLPANPADADSFEAMVWSPMGHKVTVEVFVPVSPDMGTSAEAEARVLSELADLDATVTATQVCLDRKVHVFSMRAELLEEGVYEWDVSRPTAGMRIVATATQPAPLARQEILTHRAEQNGPSSTPTRGRKPNRQRREQVAALRAEGRSPKEIAGVLGVSASRVYQLLSETRNAVPEPDEPTVSASA